MSIGKPDVIKAMQRVEVTYDLYVDACERYFEEILRAIRYEARIQVKEIMELLEKIRSESIFEGRGLNQDVLIVRIAQYKELARVRTGEELKVFLNKQFYNRPPELTEEIRELISLYENAEQLEELHPPKSFMR